MKALGDVLGYRSGGNDGDGIVGGAQVGNADECGDTQFCTSLAFYVTCQAGDYEIDASIIPNGLKHAARK